ncbi:MAG: (S)-ureidoglycine aminohydrolase [Pirellulaceae bacterium]
MEVFGSTRSRRAHDYALITPDTHVVSPLVGWENATAAIHISPEAGARFVQYTANLDAGAKSGLPREGFQRFLYVRSGSCSLALESTHQLSTGGFAFVPANARHEITCSEATQLIVFEKQYLRHPDFGSPTPVVGKASEVEGEPFMGDPDARLQTLLPITPEFDMAVNIFTYQPGATLPQVEIHVMEHGLMMLSGQGVYRLSADYMPVTEGDVIWMASYCPQWFVSMGKTPASYIYYKDIHRDV